MQLTLAHHGIDCKDCQREFVELFSESRLGGLLGVDFQAEADGGDHQKARDLRVKQVSVVTIHPALQSIDDHKVLREPFEPPFLSHQIVQMREEELPHHYQLQPKNPRALCLCHSHAQNKRQNEQNQGHVKDHRYSRNPHKQQIPHPLHASTLLRSRHLGTEP